MKYKEITDDVLLEEYRHAIYKDISVLFPLEYLKQGNVFAAFNKEGKICGGFSLITKGPLRVLESIPNFKGLKVDPDLSKTAEITGVWLSKKNKSNLRSVIFWINVVKQLLKSNKKYFVYAYTSKKIGLSNTYANALPEVLFRGETTILPGMDAPEHESVEMVYKSRVIKQLFNNPGFFIKKLVKTGASSRAHEISKDIYETLTNPLMPTISSLVELWPREPEINR